MIWRYVGPGQGQVQRAYTPQIDRRPQTKYAKLIDAEFLRAMSGIFLEVAAAHASVRISCVLKMCIRDLPA